MNWIAQSFTAMITFAIMTVLIVDLIKKGVTAQFVLLSICLLTIPAFSVVVYKNGVSTTPITFRIILIIIIAAVLSFVGNLAQFEAGAKAPNAGMAFAIVACQIVIIALISRFFMSGSLTMTQMIGISLCVAGIATISIGG